MEVFSHYGFVPEATNLSGVIHNWREDALAFLHLDAAKLLLIVVGAFVTNRVLRPVRKTVRYQSGITSAHQGRIHSSI
jgi:hypothetical protein